jgi:hypothetical protein
MHYIYLNQNDDGIHCLSDVIYFIFYNENDLANDKILESCVETVKKWFNKWTNEFEIIHYDKKACEKKQWGNDHYDIVNNSQIIIECLDDLTCYMSLEQIAFDFVEYLRISPLAINAAWYLELSNFVQELTLIRNEELKIMFSDKYYLEKCAKIVKQSSFIDNTSSPTYWDDVFKNLNIT